MKRKVYGTVLCAVLAAVGIGAAMWSAGAEEAVKSTEKHGAGIAVPDPEGRAVGERAE